MKVVFRSLLLGNEWMVLPQRLNRLHVAEVEGAFLNLKVAELFLQCLYRGRQSSKCCIRIDDRILLRKFANAILDRE